jgi:transposase InsO family protein
VLPKHAGDCADGEFAHSLNVTDIHTTWVETGALLGKSQVRVRATLEQLRAQLPFALRGIWYIQPGKLDQNAYIERFNRSYRTEVLNAHLFESLADLRALTDTWLRIYNRERPHDSLGRVPPLTFLPRPSSVGQSTFALST